MLAVLLIDFKWEVVFFQIREGDTLCVLPHKKIIPTYAGRIFLLKFQGVTYEKDLRKK